MEREQETENKVDSTEGRAARSKEAWDAFRKNADEHTVSAMPVAISYVACGGRVEHSIRRGEHLFTLTYRMEGGAATGESWEDSQRDPYTMRDEFLSCETWQDAREFMRRVNGPFSGPGPLDFPITEFMSCKTWQDARKFMRANGPFSNPEPTTWGEFKRWQRQACEDPRTWDEFKTWQRQDPLTWGEFKRWQRLANLVQEYAPLVAAMRGNDQTGECVEALKALTGEFVFQSRFFDGTEIPAKRAAGQTIQDYLNKKARERVSLCAWFRRPPATIEWTPTTLEDARELGQGSRAVRAMTDFLLPQGRWRPVLFIRPTCALQAIAAAIYADRIRGVVYRPCSRCGHLFKIGAHKNKIYCDTKGCKNTAHSARVRKNLKDAVALIIEGKKSGLTKRAIERKAKTQGISLTAHAWNKANQKSRA